MDRITEFEPANGLGLRAASVVAEEGPPAGGPADSAGAAPSEQTSNH